jgi:hypothetical protein
MVVMLTMLVVKPTTVTTLTKTATWMELAKIVLTMPGVQPMMVV